MYQLLMEELSVEFCVYAVKKLYSISPHKIPPWDLLIVWQAVNLFDISFIASLRLEVVKVLIFMCKLIRELR